MSLNFLVDECLCHCWRPVPLRAGTTRRTSRISAKQACRIGRSCRCSPLGISSSSPTTSGISWLFAQLDVHNGLIVLVPSVARSDQLRLFELALDVVESADPMNKVVEVFADGTLAVRDWPVPQETRC